ncbi:hypothetical protein N7507_010067 [Penicillium longicatenatum]|nr:hypothetical protein N7507_010067 [Penicillium longicatenatum]
MASSSVNGVDDGPATEEKAVGEPLEPVMEYPKGIEVLFIVAALGLSIILCSLDQSRLYQCNTSHASKLMLSIQTIVATAISKITSQFHSLNDISWYGLAYFMTLGAFQSTWGKALNTFPSNLVSWW